jgi:hypothetical protein
VGEDGAAFNRLFTGVYATIKPLDTVEEMLVADVVASEWEVLRWRRLKSILLRACQCKALEELLCEHLHYNLYRKDFAHDLTTILKKYPPTEQPDAAKRLAHACASNDPEAEDKVRKIFHDNTMLHSIGDILDGARAAKAEELAQKYLRSEPKAVKIVDKILARADVNIDDLIANQLDSRIDEIERIDRLATIGESRRNVSLREIDRRRAVLGEALRRSVKEVEDAEFQVVETVPPKEKITI